MSASRTVLPEILDKLPPQDPRARRSRRDLARVHYAMGSAGWLARSVRALPTPPRRILELGAGDHTLWLRVARALGARGRGTELTLLDRHDLLEPRTAAGYASLGWRVQVAARDVRDWLRDAPGAPGAPWDLVTASLFLHHFDDDELAVLLRAVAARSLAFVAWEPRRSGVAHLGSRLVALLGANAVTREDAVTSVAAGFAGSELAARWPAGGWRTRERAVGPFGHGFVAVRAP